MLQYFLDFIVLIVFIYSARIFWRIGKRKKTKQIKLLLQTIAVFIFFHLVAFPVVYLILIKNDVSSIKIEKDIVSFERSEKLKKAVETEKQIEQQLIEKQKPELESFIEEYSYFLKKIKWDSLDNKKIVFLDSFMLRGNSQKNPIPGGDYYKIIQIYTLKGSKLFEFTTDSKKTTLSEIFKDYIKEIESDKTSIVEEIETIKKDQFWNYRQILPYTLNILFTDNFNPQSRFANIIYFIHNIFVVGFLISLMMNLFQFYLLNNDR
ncbi:hypothetical protein [Flagellimonas olearia]|uniref:Uncharacterized protein n=1 Tax=Flagellimonas olearia TaxID=552546 RepID=A0A444VRR3_9FLAO|nr:hypothetical protein [Allomuricauda olearia]RYC53320.1 hypothetical protein DN53_03615 [Allomuricauda olearia]